MMVYSMFTIYANPDDFPGKHVVRIWSIWKGETIARPNLEPHWIATSLEGARASLPKGLVCLSRNDEDDPCIVESWI